MEGVLEFYKISINQTVEDKRIKQGNHVSYKEVTP